MKIFINQEKFKKREISFDKKVTLFVTLDNITVEKLLQVLQDNIRKQLDIEVYKNFQFFVCPENGVYPRQQYEIVPKLIEDSEEDRIVLITNSARIVSSIPNDLVNIYTCDENYTAIDIDKFEFTLYGQKVSFIDGLLFKTCDRPLYTENLIQTTRTAIKQNDFDIFEECVVKLNEVGLTKQNDPELGAIISLKNTKERLKNKK